MHYKWWNGKPSTESPRDVLSREGLGARSDVRCPYQPEQTSDVFERPRISFKGVLV